MEEALDWLVKIRDTAISASIWDDLPDVDCVLLGFICFGQNSRIWFQFGVNG